VRFVGESIPRVEDHRILTGRGKYVDDLILPKMLHAAFVRSPFAHARIARIDVSAATAGDRWSAALLSIQLSFVTTVPSGLCSSRTGSASNGVEPTS